MRGRSISDETKQAAVTIVLQRLQNYDGLSKHQVIKNVAKGHGMAWGTLNGLVGKALRANEASRTSDPERPVGDGVIPPIEVRRVSLPKYEAEISAKQLLVLLRAAGKLPATAKATMVGVTRAVPLSTMYPCPGCGHSSAEGCGCPPPIEIELAIIRLTWEG